MWPFDRALPFFARVDNQFYLFFTSYSEFGDMYMRTNLLETSCSARKRTGKGRGGKTPGSAWDFCGQKIVIKNLKHRKRDIRLYFVYFLFWPFPSLNVRKLVSTHFDLSKDKKAQPKKEERQRLSQRYGTLLKSVRSSMEARRARREGGDVVGLRKEKSRF